MCLKFVKKCKESLSKWLVIRAMKLTLKLYSFYAKKFLRNRKSSLLYVYYIGRERAEHSARCFPVVSRRQIGQFRRVKNMYTKKRKIAEIQFNENHTNFGRYFVGTSLYNIC